MNALGDSDTPTSVARPPPAAGERTTATPTGQTRGAATAATAASSDTGGGILDGLFGGGETDEATSTRPGRAGGTPVASSSSSEDGGLLKGLIPGGDSDESTATASHRVSSARDSTGDGRAQAQQTTVADPNATSLDNVVEQCRGGSASGSESCGVELKKWLPAACVTGEQTPLSTLARLELRRLDR